MTFISSNEVFPARFLSAFPKRSPLPHPWLGQDGPARQASPRSVGGAIPAARRVILKRIPAYIPPEPTYYPLF